MKFYFTSEEFKDVNSLIQRVYLSITSSGCWKTVSTVRYLLLTVGALVRNTTLKPQKKTRRLSRKRSRGCLHHPPGSDEQKRSNGVHIRGLLLYAGSAAHGGAYFLRYLARKYKLRPHDSCLLSCLSEATNRSERKGEGGWWQTGLKLGPFSRSGGTLAASTRGTRDNIRVHRRAQRLAW